MSRPHGGTDSLRQEIMGRSKIDGHDGLQDCEVQTPSLPLELPHAPVEFVGWDPEPLGRLLQPSYGLALRDRPPDRASDEAKDVHIWLKSFRSPVA